MQTIFSNSIFSDKICVILSQLQKLLPTSRDVTKVQTDKHRRGKLYRLLINISTYLGRLLVIRKFR